MSSSSDDVCVNTQGIRGFPEKCECGRKTLIYTSKSAPNPGRPFFRCPTHRNDHLFKWVEEAVYEEVQDALPKVECFESDICNSKVAIEAMKSVMEELMEELRKTKIELKRTNMMMKVGFGSLTFIILVVLLGFIVFLMNGKPRNLRMSSY